MASDVATTPANNVEFGQTTSSRQPATTGQDTRWLWIGIAVSFFYTVFIWLISGRLAAVPHHPDSGAAWYYWRLMEPTTAARVTAWGGYLLHQVSIWAIIFIAQKQRPRYGTGMHWFNWAALGANALFIALHTVQTHIWYGGLAEDVSIFSSQWSVILMLVLIVLMENQRRGLVLGKKVGFLKEAGGFVRRYHGYIFAWGVIYTFWYHPTEATMGHLWGFFYTFLLMLQGSLMFTRAHLNKWWTASLETLVLIHGTMVALWQGTALWSMFFFGFTGIVVLTILYGLPIARWVRWAALAAYVAGALYVYGIARGEIGDIHQITWIPIIYYLSVFVLAGLISLGLFVYNRFQSKAAPAAAQ